MVGNDRVPLTTSDHVSQENDQETGSSLNSIISSALHKHAAKKLASRKNKVLKDVTQSEREEDAQEGGKNEEVEMVQIKRDGGGKKKIKKSKKKPNADEEEGRRMVSSKKENGKDGHKESELMERPKKGKGGGNEPDTPTREYLKAVAVPKKKGKKKKRQIPVENDAKVLGVTIHSADCLELLPPITPHPLVKVYICDVESGTLLEKMSSERKVTSYYESENVHNILPMMTQAYDCRKHRSLICRWEEELIFNEPVQHFTSSDVSVIIFFQVMDFYSSTRFSSQRSQSQVGWKTLTWGFLKMRGRNNHINIGQRLRLQLWRPRKTANVDLVELYSWWKSGNRNKYPSTLYVTLREVEIPTNPNPALRSMLATQQEQGGTALDEVLQEAATSNNDSSVVDSVSAQLQLQWNRNPSQMCKIPNHMQYTLPSSEQGCLIVKFSNNGLRLACGAYKEIIIYDVLTGNCVAKIPGHLGLIYDICWSMNDDILLTASADSTARVWYLTSEKVSSRMKLLTHPTFVYVARFHPGDTRLLFTGGYDHVIRVWMLSKEGEYRVVQEVMDHLGFVNAFCFNGDNSLFYSGDKQGVIKVWKITVPKKTKGKNVQVLTIEEDVKITDIAGHVINNIVYHPGGHRLLVHARDGQVCLVNRQRWVATHRLKGALNVCEQIRSCVSPCGTWVLSGSEDRGVYVWNADTGEIASAFWDLPFEGTTSCVDFHPHDHILAVSSCSLEAPIVILTYKADAAPIDSPVPLAVQPLSSRSSSPKISTYLTPKKETFDMSHVGPTMNPTSTPRSSIGVSPDMPQTSIPVVEDDNKELLHKLDNVLKMAMEEPLNMSSLLRGSRPPPTGKLATALFNFKASESDEMSVRRGDIVMVLRESNKDWWLVQSSDLDLTGLVPANYLEYLPDRSSDGTRIERSYEASKVIAVPSGSGHVSFISDTEGTPSQARARRHRMRQNVSNIISSTPKKEEGEDSG
ncbi:jouberin-like isoform X2 [Oratosquilla oratoria]|uniref:jouberin-like isoform X2 n=1 Tax=Oratosquilla oratoria TaxID=337810 RepID=UPI003F7762F0